MGLQELTFLGESDHVFPVMASVATPCRSGPSATTLSATGYGAIVATARRTDVVFRYGTLNATGLTCHGADGLVSSFSIESLL